MTVIVNPSPAPVDAVAFELEEAEPDDPPTPPDASESSTTTFPPHA